MQRVAEDSGRLASAGSDGLKRILASIAVSATATLAINAAKAAAKRDYTGYVNIVDPQGQTLHVPFWVRFVKKKK